MFKQCTEANGFSSEGKLLSCSNTPMQSSDVFPLPARDIQIPRYVKTPRPGASKVYDYLLRRPKRSLFERFVAFIAEAVEKVKCAVICK